jgi:uncharacterized membrane protein YdjX (TVP38/TMEM64 family)
MATFQPPVSEHDPFLAKLAFAAPASTEPSFLGRNWPKLAALSIWLLLLGGFFGYMYVNKLTLLDTLSDVVSLLQTPYGPLLFLLLYAIRPLGFLSSTLYALISGAVFGPVLGIIYTVVGSNASATVAYVVGRFLGRGVLANSQATNLMQRYADKLRNNTFTTLLIMHFIFLPYDLVNYTGGFLRVRYRPYILATILGSLPGTFTFVLAGSSISIAQIVSGDFGLQFEPGALVASAFFFVLCLSFAAYLKWREARREAAAAPCGG